MFFYLFISMFLVCLCDVFQFSSSLIGVFHILPLLPLSRYPLSREDSYLSSIPTRFYVILTALGALPQISAFTFFFTADPQLFMIMIACSYATCSLLLLCYDSSDCFFLKPFLTLTHSPSLLCARRFDRYLICFFALVSVCALLSGLFLTHAHGFMLMITLSLTPYLSLPWLLSHVELQRFTTWQLFIMLSYAFFDLSLPEQSIVELTNLSD